jgi:hypothetical protein
MFKLRCVLPIIVLVFAALAGCSDHAVSPTGDGSKTPMGMVLSIADVGPSEIVLAVDVSDTVSNDELQAMVDALGSCLADPSLIPQDGTITVATLVYGDSVAAITAPTPVTSTSLQNTILPALNGLLTDRVVGGAGADLTGALSAADTILAKSSVSDRHVLVMGSGAADDPTGAVAESTALGVAGVMVSAIGINPDKSGADLLNECADVTGGFFGAGDENDQADLCEDALAYMLQVDIDLEPETKDLPRGETHKGEAKVFRGGDPKAWPVEGQEVTISIVSGPNSPLSAATVTDTNGVVTFEYTGIGGPGTDVIVAETLHPGTGSTLVDTVTVTWINAAPTCDAGGPYKATVDADTVAVQLDGSSSSDAEDDSLRYHWSLECEDAWFDDATSATPTLYLAGDCVCVDSLTVDLAVSDGFDTTACFATVYVDDVRPPTIIVKDEPLRIWPPNHKYRTVEPGMLLEAAYDACGDAIDLSRVVVVEVRSDEPEDHKGDGRTVDDIVVMCPNTVELRAERMGGGDGRVYTITYRIAGENGVTTDVEARAFVPHDASDDTAVDSEGGYSVETDCADDN